MAIIVMRMDLRGLQAIIRGKERFWEGSWKSGMVRNMRGGEILFTPVSNGVGGAAGAAVLV